MAAPRGPALSLVCTTCVWYLCVRVHTSSPHKVVPQHQHSQKACVCRNWLCPTVPVHIPNGDAARDGETAGISSGRQEAEEAVALQQQVQQKKSGSSRTSSTSTNATATSSQQHQLQHQYQHQRQAARQPGSQAARQRARRHALGGVAVRAESPGKAVDEARRDDPHEGRACNQRDDMQVD